MCKIRKMMAIRRKNSQKLKTRRRLFKFKNPIHKTLKKYIKKLFIMMIIYQVHLRVTHHHPPRMTLHNPPRVYLKNKRKLKIFR